MSTKRSRDFIAIFLKRKGIDPEKISEEISTDCGRKISVKGNVLSFTFKEETKDIPLAEVISAYRVA